MAALQQQPSSKVLVTGGAGFVGRHVVDALLERGYSARCLALPTERTDAVQARGAEIAIGDIVTGEGLDEAVRDVSAIIHLAGATHPSPDEVLHAVNFDGTRNLLKAVVRNGTADLQRIVHVSTVWVAGRDVSKGPFDEDHPIEPANEYARSKWRGE